MKLVIVNGDGKSLGEVKLSQRLLRQPEMLTERIERIIESSFRTAIIQSSDRIVENDGIGTLESLDEDISIMDVPLRLSEACKFDFDKHMHAITEQEDQAYQNHKKHTKLNYAQENSKEYDARYKEHPGNRIRFK